MFRQNLVEALRNLVGARQRTVLALIGIVIGAGAVIAMINIGTIVSEEALRQFRSLGVDLAVLSSRGVFDGESKGLDQNEVQAMAIAVDAVRIAAPIINAGGEVRADGRRKHAQVVGTTREFFDIAQARPARGRFVDRLDGFQTFATVGVKLAQPGPDGAPALDVGAHFLIGSRQFTVVGVLEPAGYSPLIPVNVDSTVFVPIDTTLRLTESPEIGEIAVRLSSEAASATLQAEVEDYLRTAKPGVTLEVRTARELIDQMERQMQLYTVLLGAIGAISLIVGGVGVMNVMLVSVTERRQEIGIRLALGARRRDVRTLFLVESVALSVIGGLLGTGLGVAASWVFASQTGWQFTVAPAAIPLGAGVSIAVGVFFGFYPAVMASRLNIVDALRA